MASSASPPRRTRSPPTPASSVRAIVSWLEKSGRSDEKDATRTTGCGSESASGHAVRTTRRAHGTALPSPVVVTPPPSSSSHNNNNNNNDNNSINNSNRNSNNNAASGTTGATSATAVPTTTTPQPSSPFGRTLFPRNACPVRRTSASGAAAAVHYSSPSTPTTPSWRRRGIDRAAALNDSPSSLPATVAIATAADTPRSPTTGYDTPEDYSLTLLKYKAYFNNRPLARCMDDVDEQGAQNGEAGRPAPAKTNGNDERGRDIKANGCGRASEPKRIDNTKSANTMDAAASSAGVALKRQNGEVVNNHAVPRRHGQDMDAFWAPIRQYLLITDEELYES